MARLMRTTVGTSALCCVVAMGCSSAFEIPSVDEIWGYEYNEDDELKEFVRHNPPKQWWKELRNDDGTFSGKLVGTKARHHDGQVESKALSAKGVDPLELTLGYHRLPLLCETETLAEQLVSASGRQVRLKSHVDVARVRGKTSGMGQQGFHGALPDHRLTFLLVTEVVSVD